jgi:hypothetical protein
MLKGDVSVGVVFYTPGPVEARQLRRPLQKKEVMYAWVTLPD